MCHWLLQPPKREDYAYDANDNRLTLEQRTSKTAPLPTMTFTSAITPGTNRLASVTDGTTPRPLTYDGRGNNNGEVHGATTITALYDAYGRLNSYARTGSQTWTMRYNGSDKRVEAKVGGATPKRFIYDEGDSGAFRRRARYRVAA